MKAKLFVPAILIAASFVTGLQAQTGSLRITDSNLKPASSSAP